MQSVVSMSRTLEGSSRLPVDKHHPGDGAVWTARQGLVVECLVGECMRAVGRGLLADVFIMAGS